MASTAHEFAQDAKPLIVEDPASFAEPWSPLFWLPCSFNPVIFADVMLNLIKNPNINSSWLFRADILHDEDGDEGLSPLPHLSSLPQIPSFNSFKFKRYMIRKLIPRNTQRDAPLDQTCLFYESSQGSGDHQVLVVYLPHVSAQGDFPFYHPKVRGIAFLHRWNPQELLGTVSISYLFLADSAPNPKLIRTALNLLTVLHKHGEGRVTGYVKRVHHDVIVPQAPFQNRYTLLKQKYAKSLIETWAESTRPSKHVFEDLGIAAFLIELWTGMYGDDSPFPGFVDIGCGNGLLTHILNKEGYPGWGFDARSRKSWAAYNTAPESSPTKQEWLKQLILIPSVVRPCTLPGSDVADEMNESETHDGLFPRGTFIISNHADELTPWTPILAAASQCPFIMIPCCSHNLTGAKFRAPPPKDKTKSESAYSSLVSWVSGIASDCGWEVETEMLRIPSTRNTALLGRKRYLKYESLDVHDIIRKYGGTDGYLSNALKLVKISPRGH